MRASLLAPSLLPALCCVALSACGLVDETLALQNVLEKNSGADELTLNASDVYPDAERIFLVCPYSGHVVDEELGTDLFDTYDEANDTSNWVVIKERRGATLKIHMDRTQVDVCPGDVAGSGDVVDGVVEASPTSAWSFEQRDGTWVLVELRED